MILSLPTLLQDFSTVRLIRYCGEGHPHAYTDAVWMGVFSGDFQKDCIYIGKMSQFPENIPSNGMALVVVNDTGRDLSSTGIEVAEVAPETELAELCLLIQKNLRPTHEMTEMAQTLLSGLFNNCGINEIIDAAFVYLNNPIMVAFSQNFKNAYYSCGKRPNHMDEFYGPEEAVRERESFIGYAQLCKSVHKELDEHGLAIMEDNGFFEGKRRVVSAITQGTLSREQMGAMVVLEVNRPINAKDLSLIRVICRLISEKCASQSFRESLIHSFYEQRLQELLQGKWTENGTDWVSDLFGKAPHEFLLAAVDIQTASADGVESLRYLFSGAIRADMTLTCGPCLIAVTNLSGRDIALYRSQMGEIAKKHHVVIAGSSLFHDIRNLKKYYTQAKMLLRCVQRFGLTDQFCEFPLMQADVLINEVAEKMDLDVFAGDDLERLLAFDAANHCEYYRTLMTWMHSGLNREEVRKQLHIHRNTLSYRLERIEEILGMKLNEGNNLLNLYLSAAIRERRLLDLGKGQEACSCLDGIR